MKMDCYFIRVEADGFVYDKPIHKRIERHGEKFNIKLWNTEYCFLFPKHSQIGIYATTSPEPYVGGGAGITPEQLRTLFDMDTLKAVWREASVPWYRAQLNWLDKVLHIYHPVQYVMGLGPAPFLEWLHQNCATTKADFGKGEKSYYIIEQDVLDTYLRDKASQAHLVKL